MCFEKVKFENIHKHRKNAIVIGDNSILKVQGIENVLLQGKILENVLYAPKLTMNLLLVIQVARKGYSFKFNSHSWCMKKGLATVVKGSMKDDLYIVNQTLTKICLATNVCSSKNLWHHLLGHLNHKNIQVMKDQELVEGFPMITPTIGLYEMCILEKMNR